MIFKFRHSIFDQTKREHVDKYQCSICIDSFSSGHALKVHLRRFHDLQNASLEDTCEQESNWGQHRRFKSVLPAKKSPPKEGQRVICEICGANVSSKHVQRHIKNIHTQGRAFGCDHCAATFNNKNKLENHVLTHCLGENFTRYQLKKLRLATRSKNINVVCSVCGKVYANKILLKMHEATHEEKRFKCNVSGCDKKYRWNGMLQRHIKIGHLNEREFKCTYLGCDKAFARMRYLRNHVQLIHENLRKPCPVGGGCTFSVGRSDYMKNHLKKHSELSSEELSKYWKIIKEMKLAH